jgi:spore germination cell wall hydrolase CwlJ-like protein
MNEFSPKEIILAKTIYGEARGLYTKQDGGLAALISIANVVMNRLAAKSWFGKSIEDVCFKALSIFLLELKRPKPSCNREGVYFSTYF